MGTNNLLRCFLTGLVVIKKVWLRPENGIFVFVVLFLAAGV